MKKNAVTQKLVLTKTTIAHLDELEMIQINGGTNSTTPLTYCSCQPVLCKDSFTDNTQDNC